MTVTLALCVIAVLVVGIVVLFRLFGGRPPG